MELYKSFIGFYNGCSGGSTSGQGEARQIRVVVVCVLGLGAARFNGSNLQTKIQSPETLTAGT